MHLHAVVYQGLRKAPTRTLMYPLNAHYLRVSVIGCWLSSYDIYYTSIETQFLLHKEVKQRLAGGTPAFFGVHIIIQQAGSTLCLCIDTFYASIEPW